MYGQTDRQIDIFIYICKDRQRNRQIDRKILSQIDRQVDRYVYIQIDRSIVIVPVGRGKPDSDAVRASNPLYLSVYIYIDRQIDRQIERWTDRWMDKWIDRQIKRYVYVYIYIQMHIYIYIYIYINTACDRARGPRQARFRRGAYPPPALASGLNQDFF